MLRISPLPLFAVAVALVPAPAAESRPVAPPPRPVLDAGLDPALADWTPRPATGKAEPWEMATDADWKDGRFRQMDTGPFLNCTMDYPRDKGKERVFKATVVKLGEKGDAAVVFDRCTMRLAAGWAGGWLNHSDRRFGLLNTPTPKGGMVFASVTGPGWFAADQDDHFPTPPPLRPTIPLPKSVASYKGLYLHKGRVVLAYRVDQTDIFESFSTERHNGMDVLVAHLEIGPSKKTLYKALFGGRNDRIWMNYSTKTREVVGLNGEGGSLLVGIITDGGRYGAIHGPGIQYFFPPADAVRRYKLLIAPYTAANDPVFRRMVRQDAGPHEYLAALTKGGPKRWGEPIVTKLVRGKEDGPFAVDTLTLPYDNPYKALLFCTGIDFLPDGRVAVCTCHGDVWFATIDETAGTVAWQRFATGLYQPLGLKVVNGKVVVLERGQLTRLHDTNGDGEADFYECLCNDWHTGGGDHSYDTCLETDPQGNFYFFKTGDTNLPHGGCLLKVSPDGGKVEVVATGFRHPIGLGISPSGIVTGADQEGNWMPATRIDQYRKGGFYGDMRAHHRATPPTTYDPPICWVPREVDNSAGGQVWVPNGEPGVPTAGWGPLAGLPLHLSYGRCKAFVLLRQELPDGRVQGGVADLGLTFLSGVCRGRFRPSDGHLYLCGLNGWQTAAKADGCVQRVRSTGKPFDLPVKLAVEGDTVRLTFSRPLDAGSIGPEHFRAAWWNYHWSGDYGSKRWKVSDATRVGQDDVPVRGVELEGGGRTVVLRFDRLRPVMQMQVAYNVSATDGRPVVGSVFLTIHDTGK
jgi:hypothetical protein